MQTSAASTSAYLRTDFPTPIAKGSKPDGDQNFADLVADVVQKANATQHEASAGIRELVAGNVDNVHEVVLKAAKADLSFRFLLEVRNKVTEAYQEISRMPL